MGNLIVSTKNSDSLTEMISRGASQWDVRKIKIIKTQVSKIRKANKMLNSSLASMNLLAALEESSEEFLHKSLKDKSRAIREAGGVNKLKDLIGGLPTLLERSKEILYETESFLNEYQERDGRLKSQFGDRWITEPSDVCIKKVTQNSKDTFFEFHEHFGNAFNAHDVIRGKFESQLKKIKLLCRSEEKIETAFYRSSSSDNNQSSPTFSKQLRLLVTQMTDMRSEREVLVQELISAFVAMKQPRSVVSIEKLVEIRNRVRASLDFQVHLIDQIQVLNEDFVLFDELEEVRYSLEESNRFYNELIQLLMDFQSKILDFCLAREDDWKELARSLAASTTHSLENRSRVNSVVSPVQYSLQPPSCAQLPNFGNQPRNDFLASMKLPAPLEKSNEISLLQSVKDKARALREAGGIEKVKKLIGGLPSLFERNKEILDKAEQLLNEERKWNEELKVQFKDRWNETPSYKLTYAFTNKIAEYRKILQNAFNRNNVVCAKFEIHRKGIELLLRLEGGIETALSLVGHPLMLQVNDLKSEGDALKNALKSATVNMNREPAMTIEKFGEVYGSIHKRIQESLQESLELQGNLIQVLHDEMKPEKSGDGRSTREVLFQELDTAYDVALEVTHELREEHKFYNELILLLLDFQLYILEFCLTREGERESKLQKFLPVPTIPSSENSSRVNTVPKPIPTRPPPPNIGRTSSSPAAPHLACLTNQEPNPNSVQPRVPPKIPPRVPHQTALKRTSEMMDSSANSVPTKTKVTPLKEVLHVILLQRPNGSFKLDRILAQYLGTSLYDIVGAGEKANCPGELWPTLIAISFLEIGHPKSRKFWGGLVDIGHSWLHNCPQFDRTLKDKSDNFVKSKLKLKL